MGSSWTTEPKELEAVNSPLQFRDDSGGFRCPVLGNGAIQRFKIGCRV